MKYRLGVDIGGTFTDFILADSTGGLTEAKVPSRREDPGVALREGIGLLARKLETSEQALLEDCDLVIHGTTVATNALIQHSGARTGLLCTYGFRDTLRMREGYKEERYDFSQAPPRALVPRDLCLGIRERISQDGAILVPLDEEHVRDSVRRLRTLNVEAIAVAFLWSFVNPVHEHEVAMIVQDEFPEVYLSLSSDIVPELRYYDRMSTTVMNAFLGPVVSNYIEKIELLLRSLGYRKAIRYTQCSGGIGSGDTLKKKPVLALDSGPSMGPAAGFYFGRQLGVSNIITIDMGGTSFDVCLVERGTPPYAKNVDVQRYRFAIPHVEVNAVGAGGGSIASVETGLLTVGPRSAEAMPGPACYGKGGTNPTVSDADLVLGYLNAKNFLGGRIDLDEEAALTAIRVAIGEPLGLTTDQASRAIFELVNQNMVRAIREVSVERGHDPRDFVLVVGGGCGPIHAASLARELGIGTVVIPKVASTFCAFGAVVAEVRHDLGMSYPTRLRDLDVRRLNEIFDNLEAAGFAALAEDGVPESERRSQRILEMRYLDQIHECSVEIPHEELSLVDVSELEARFHDRHLALYTYSEPDHETELVNVRVSTLGPSGAVTPMPASGAASDSEVGRARESTTRVQAQSHGTRRVQMDGEQGAVECPIYDGDRLSVGMTIEGPAIVEERHTTVVIPRNVKLDYRTHEFYVMDLTNTTRN